MITMTPRVRLNAIHFVTKEFNKYVHLDVLHVINLSRTTLTSVSPSLARATVHVMVSEGEFITCMLQALGLVPGYLD